MKRVRPFDQFLNVFEVEWTDIRFLDQESRQLLELRPSHPTREALAICPRQDSSKCRSAWGENSVIFEILNKMPNKYFSSVSSAAANLIADWLFGILSRETGLVNIRKSSLARGVRSVSFKWNFSSDILNRLLHRFSFSTSDQITKSQLYISMLVEPTLNSRFVGGTK